MSKAPTYTQPRSSKLSVSALLQVVLFGASPFSIETRSCLISLHIPFIEGYLMANPAEFIHCQQ
ncbi:CLUMA_CG020026, isoform A [Clunio marinus]|uniref:CLUMA_CG020026, isoform A n=1 Tax=Clunio marinus TaxID=568069 RepID=A0A1J1J504_9DIPT|nr:CLUMA_CG020026, isoform A [Clunio marinus]